MTGPRVGSLFTGAAGLEMGVHAVIGGRTVWHCDPDPDAGKALAHHYPDVPNLGDITAVDWTTVEPVDVLTGGFPCQDLSTAGARSGMRDGTRSGLWASYLTAIDALRPQLVIIENVRGLLSAEADSALEYCPGCMGDRHGGPVLRALGRVLGDLASLGFDAEWQGLPASDVGAPHGRFRVFVAAWPATQDTDSATRRERWLTAPGQATSGRSRPDAGGSGGARTGLTLLPTPSVADSTGGHLNRSGERSDELLLPGAARELVQSWGKYEPAIRRWEALTRPAPAPALPGPKGGMRLNPAFAEWMLGWPAGWVTDVPGISRNAQLRLCGNGVVPAQAAAALEAMLPAMTAREASA